MGTRRRLIVVVLALGASGCKAKEPPPAPSPPPSARPSPDRLAKGEIAEGRERAFTLPLPVHSEVKARFQRSIHVASPHTHEELSNFVRVRIKEGKTSMGASETRFDSVVVTKDPSKTLTIEVRPAAIVGGEYRSQIVVNDVTPAPEEPGLTDADRWRKAGMSPDGKLLNRDQLQ